MPRRNDPPTDGEAALAEAVDRCRRDRRFLDELAEILRRAEASLADGEPTCEACGRCCRFEQFGHRLYVSTGELALLCLSPPNVSPIPLPSPGRGSSRAIANRERAATGRERGLRKFRGPAEAGLCPYQRGSQCGARDRRCLGCRVFFCDPALKERSEELYERAHREIRRLHARAGLPYRYVELTAALAELAAEGP